MELNLEAILQEAALQAGNFFNRCLLLAGENAELKNKLKAKDDQIAELVKKLSSVEAEKVVPIK